MIGLLIDWVAWWLLVMMLLVLLHLITTCLFMLHVELLVVERIVGKILLLHLGRYNILMFLIN